MPISTDHVGRTYPVSEPYRVSRAKIAEFASALGGSEGGDANSAYRGEDPMAPPTFAVVVAFRAWDDLFHDEELDVKLNRVVHANQSFAWQRQLREGDDITAQLRIDEIKFRGPSEWITITVDLATTEGELVCNASSTFVHSRPEGA